MDFHRITESAERETRRSIDRFTERRRKDRKEGNEERRKRKERNNKEKRSYQLTHVTFQIRNGFSSLWEFLRLHGFLKLSAIIRYLALKYLGQWGQADVWRVEKREERESMCECECEWERERKREQRGNKNTSSCSSGDSKASPMRSLFALDVFKLSRNEKNKGKSKETTSKEVLQVVLPVKAVFLSTKQLRE